MKIERQKVGRENYSKKKKKDPWKKNNSNVETEKRSGNRVDVLDWTKARKILAL
jgi:hypothetical protein